MSYCCKYLYSLVMLPAMLVFQIKVSGQADSLSGHNDETVSKTESSSRIHSLYAGVGYGSNMIYLESTISRGRPYYSANVTYGFRNSFYISASASHIDDTSPFVAFSSLNLNYRHTFNSWFDISADLAGYKTADMLQKTLFSDFAFINFTSGFDWKILYTKLSLGGVFSVSNKGYIQLSNSRYFQTPEFFKAKAFVSFNPDIKTLFGEVVKITSALGTTRYRYFPPFWHFRKIQTNPVESYSSKFGLIDFEFCLPVTFNCNNLSIECEPGYFLPAYSNQEYPEQKGMFFNLTVYFRIL